MLRRRDVLSLTALCGGAIATSASAAMLRRAMAGVPATNQPTRDQLPPRVAQWERSFEDSDMVSPVEFDGAFAYALEVYDEIISAKYVAPGFPTILLNLAYKRAVRQEDRFHWPEYCYATQGYNVRDLPNATVGYPHSPDFKRFLATSLRRSELVAYVVALGDRKVQSPNELRVALFEDSLALNVPDGLLFRASVETKDAQDTELSWNTMRQFFPAFLSEAGRKLRLI